MRMGATSASETREPSSGRGASETRAMTGGARSSAADANLPKSPGMELDLRGQRADDALTELERFLDAAYLAGMPFVRIIHGKGTGKLRDAVRQALQGHTYVRSFEGGGEKEGGEGVTIVKLAA